MKIIPNFISRMFKRNAAISNAYLSMMGQPIYTNWTVHKAVKDGYKINGWVYRSVFLISKAGSQVPWAVVDKDGELVDGHHLTKLLNKPNPHVSRQDMFELIIDWLELAGNSYLKKVKVGGKTQELWPVSPDRIAPIPAKKIDEWIKGYSLDQKQSVVFEPEEIIHHKFMDPSNPLIGIGPLQAAARAVDSDNAQQNWNTSAMQNRGVIDGLISFKREFESQDQVDKVSERINESTSGPKNARKIKVVGSEATYSRMGLNPAEMDFAASRAFNRDEIFIIFGIPPAYGGSQEASTYNNFTTAELVFWFQTEIPLLDDLKDTFNMSFADELEPGQKINYSLANIPAIRRAMKEKTEAGKVLYEMGVPFEQINKQFELGFEEFEGWEKSNPKINNANIQVDPAARTAKYTLIERREETATAKKIAKLAEGPVKDIFLNLLEKQQEAIFKDLTEKNLLKVMAASKTPWAETMLQLYLDVGGKAGSDLVVEKRAIDPDLNQAMIEFLETEQIILTEVSLILETTATQVLLHIQEGVAEGLPIATTQQAIIDSGTFSPARALAIARTETGTAANIGQVASATLSGATHKTWHTSGFEVRDSHKRMNGKKVKIDKDFTVGGEKAGYPLDNRLSAAERVNCRCTLTYSIED